MSATKTPGSPLQNGHGLLGNKTEAQDGWLAQLATLDLPASGALTRLQLDWVPTGPGLLTDLRETDYDAI